MNNTRKRRVNNIKTEKQIRDLLEQYEYERKLEKSVGIQSDKFTRNDLIIRILKWVLDEDRKSI